nr:hypothetical protein [Mesorhizobium sp.]
MAKTKAKAAPAATPGESPKKRSKVKLILFALVPLIVLGGGGYGAWAYFLAPAPEVHAEAEGHGGIDPQKVAALKAEADAETSATYNFALAQLLRSRCGGLEVVALKAASDAEAAHDGMLVSMSWQAALRRAGTVTEASCDRILAEIDHAEVKAGGGEPAGGHGEKPKSGH